jgi:hypothetical protein
LHFLEKIFARGWKGTLGIGAMGVSAWAVVGGPQGSKPIFITAFEML